MKPKKQIPTSGDNTVEQICGRRVRNGKVEYSVKWKNHDESKTTWRPVEKLDCTKLIQQYEEKLKKEENLKGDSFKKDNNINASSSEKRKTEVKPSVSKRPRSEDLDANYSICHFQSNSFDNGCHAEKILGAFKSNGTLIFVIKFKGVEQTEMVPAEIAKIKIPQLVIKFYEERLSWYSDDE